VGEKTVSQSAFTIQGNIEAAPSKLGAIGKTGGAEQGGSIASALGGFGGDEVGPAATAEWLDYEIRVPGERPEQLRRPVFDLLGPARRASKPAGFDGNDDLSKLQRFEALFSNTAILFQVSNFTDEFVASLFADRVAANQAELHELSRERDPSNLGKRAGLLLGRLTRWGPLPNLVLWRSLLAGESADTFPDRPNILNFRVSRTISNADKPVSRLLVDMASNRTRTRWGAEGNPFDLRLRQGVADTVAEMLALGNDLKTSGNTASIFSRLASEGSRGLLIGAGDLAAAKALPWPEDEAARVAADVSAGYMVLVPRKAVLLDGEQHVAWWRVDPASGATIGVMDTGLHGAVDEKALIESMIREIEEFIAANPLPPIGSMPVATWYAQYGGLAVLLRALTGVLYTALSGGYCVPSLGPC
jgi:hypothetical protein